MTASTSEQPSTPECPSAPRSSAPAFPARERGGVLGIVLFLLGPLQYFLFEAVVAGAWRDPRYSYYYNFVSDLGVVDGPVVYQERQVESPIGLLMNGSFILLGVLSAVGILVLSRSLPRSAHRLWVRIAAVAFGAGAIMVGLFPENGIELAHVVGAFLNIGFGIVLVILVGARGERYYGIPRWLARTLIAVAAIASAAATALATLPAFLLGAVERVAAYGYLFSFLALALAGLWRLNAQQPPTRSAG